MTTFYPGTIIPMASVPPPGGIPTAASVYSGAVANMNNNIGAPINTSPSFATGQGISPSNNINGTGLPSSTTPIAFSANPPQPSFNSFSSSPSNLTGIPQRTTSGFNPTFFRGSFPTMSPTMSADQPSYEPPPTEGSFSGQSFTPTNSFVDNPFTGTSNEFGGPPSFSGSPPLSMGAMGGTNDPFSAPMGSFGGTQVASISNPMVDTNLLAGTPQVRTATQIAQNPFVAPPRTNPYAPPFNDITGAPVNGPTGISRLEMITLAKPELGTNGAGFLSGQGFGSPEPPAGGIIQPDIPGITGGIQPAPMDFGFGSSGPPLPPTDPRSSFNGGASIQSNPYPGITGGIQPAPQDFGFGNPGNLPPLPPTVNSPNIPLPPTNPLGPFNAGMGSIQGAPTPTPFEQSTPSPFHNIYPPNSALNTTYGGNIGAYNPVYGSPGVAANQPSGFQPSPQTANSQAPFGYPSATYTGLSSSFGNTPTQIDPGDKSGNTTSGVRNPYSGISFPFSMPNGPGNGPSGSFTVTGPGFYTGNVQQFDTGPFQNYQAGLGSFNKAVDMSNTLLQQNGQPTFNNYGNPAVQIQQFPTDPLSNRSQIGSLSGFGGTGAFLGPPSPVTSAQFGGPPSPLTGFY